MLSAQRQNSENNPQDMPGIISEKLPDGTQLETFEEILEKLLIITEKKNLQKIAVQRNLRNNF